MAPDTMLRPLVSAEEDWLAAELAAGRRPTVHLLATSGDLAAGARGRLVIADHARDGEYLQVDVSGDRLPFAATELALPPTVARRVRKAAGVVDPPPPVRRPRAARRPRGELAAVPHERATRQPTKAVPTKAVPTKAVPTNAVPTTAVPTKPPGTAPRSKAGRRRPLAPVTVTIAFDGGNRWTAEATSGGKRLRPVEISAAAAAAATDALGVAEVRDVVTAVTEAMRADAQSRTDALRAQLAAAEAELARFSRR